MGVSIQVRCSGIRGWYGHDQRRGHGLVAHLVSFGIGHDAGARLFLWRHGSQEEYPIDAQPEFHYDGADEHSMGALWL